MKKRRVLVLMHENCLPPDDAENVPFEDMSAWKMEYDILVTLQELGHVVQPLGVGDELAQVKSAIEKFKPHITFNLLEDFHGITVFDQHVVAFLELMRQPYTGCNPRGMMLTRDKALCKKILTYHRIRVPRFGVFPVGRVVRRPRKLEFPLFVKSTVSDASAGISQASIVHDDEKLKARVKFVHEQVGTDAIAEQYIEGRELYMGVLGNQRLQTFPAWEMVFRNLPEDAPRIATSKVKFDLGYQKRSGITTQAARDLPPGVQARITHVTKRIYRVLGMNGYARMDFRLTPDGQLYVLEANPNPHLAYGEDFAESAHKSGLPYDALIQRILNLGLRYRPHGHT
jgi:D-alanine-D-alanine ligase